MLVAAAASVLMWLLLRKPSGTSPVPPAADTTSLETRDKLDEAQIEQLHKAVTQFGANCFELKKLCVTVVFAAATLLATLTGKQLDAAFFVGALIAIVVFWLLDAQSYYYQEKLRARMKKLAEGIGARHALIEYTDGVGMPLSEARENRSPSGRAIHALFNWSMFFYMVLGCVVAILLALYLGGIIDNTSFVRTVATAHE
ncbi:MAG TPA: hypothetical protein VF432_02340 [Thermoanaerobaculia bacterium]